MIEVSLADALNDSINRLQAGQSVADCVAIYPQHANELESLLTVGGVVSWSQPSVAEAAQAEARGQFGFERALDQPWSQSRSFAFSPLARLAASLVLVFAFLATGVGIMAEDSLPGDALYNVKLFTETLRLTLSNHDPATEAMFDSRRLEEARAVTQFGREVEMTLKGRVEAKTNDGLRLDGLLVLTDDAQDLTGSLVEVDVVSTAQGELVAREIRLRGAPVSVPPLTETATELPTQFNTPLPTNTPVASATRTPVPTRRPTMTRQPTSDRPSASATPGQRGRSGECEGPPSDWVRYIVQGGDTLSDLIARSGGSMDTVATANCIDDVRHIVAGQTIFLPRVPVRTAPTMTAEADSRRTPVREGTHTPVPQREGDSQRDREQQREGDSNDSGAGDSSGGGRGR